MGKARNQRKPSDKHLSQGEVDREETNDSMSDLKEFIKKRKCQKEAQSAGRDSKEQRGKVFEP